MQISTREFKANLSAVLRRVRDGEEISVTSHGKVVARLSPPLERVELGVDRLRRQPWATVPKGPVRALGLPVPIHWQGEGPSFTDLLLEDRD